MTLEYATSVLVYISNVVIGLAFVLYLFVWFISPTGRTRADKSILNGCVLQVTSDEQYDLTTSFVTPDTSDSIYHIYTYRTSGRMLGIIHCVIIVLMIIVYAVAVLTSFAACILRVIWYTGTNDLLIQILIVIGYTLAFCASMFVSCAIKCGAIFMMLVSATRSCGNLPDDTHADNITFSIRGYSSIGENAGSTTMYNLWFIMLPSYHSLMRCVSLIYLVCGGIICGGLSALCMFTVSSLLMF